MGKLVMSVIRDRVEAELKRKSEDPDQHLELNGNLTDKEALQVELTETEEHAALLEAYNRQRHSTKVREERKIKFRGNLDKPATLYEVQGLGTTLIITPSAKKAKEVFDDTKVGASLYRIDTKTQRKILIDQRIRYNPNLYLEDEESSTTRVLSAQVMEALKL